MAPELLDELELLDDELELVDEVEPPGADPELLDELELLLDDELELDEVDELLSDGSLSLSSEPPQPVSATAEHINPTSKTSRIIVIPFFSVEQNKKYVVWTGWSAGGGRIIVQKLV